VEESLAGPGRGADHAAEIFAPDGAVLVGEHIGGRLVQLSATVVIRVGSSELFSGHRCRRAGAAGHPLPLS
jgi:hypothetical protein